MKWKTTLALLIATVALGAYVSLVELKRPTQEEQERLAKQVVQVSAGAVMQLEITMPTASVTLQREQNAWRLAAPVAARADASVAERIISALDPLEAERVLTGTPEQPLARAEFGLEPPRGTLTVQAGPTRAILQFGEATAVGGNRYVAVAGNPAVFVTGPELFDALNQPVDAYRSKELVDLEGWAITRIAVWWSPPAIPRPVAGDIPSEGPQAGARVEGSPARSFTLSRDGDRWQLTEPVADEADRASVSTLISSLRRLRSERVIAEEPTGEQVAALEPAAARVTLAAEQRPAPLELVIGGPTADQPDQRHVKRSDEPALHAVANERIDALLQDPNALRSRALFTFAAGQVRQVQVAWHEASWTLEKQEGQWRLALPASGQPALDQAKIEEWLGKLRDMSLTRFVVQGPEGLGYYGLEPPMGSVQVWVTGGDAPQQLLVGRLASDGQARYGRITGRDSVVEVPALITDLLSVQVDSFKAEAQSAVSPAPPAE